jgi:hypothetical protein
MLSDRFRAAVEGGDLNEAADLFSEDPVDRVAILEFATVVDGKDVEGIDKLTFDDNRKDDQ